MECFADFLNSMVDIELISEAADIGQQSKESQDRARGNALARSGYVLLCGYFEGFLRDLITEFINQIDDSKIKVSKMPNTLLHSAINDALGRQDPDDAAALVKTSILGNTHLPVNPEKHAKTGGNPTVDTIEAMFNAIGFPKVIDALSIQDFCVTSTFTTESQTNSQIKLDIESALEMNSQSNIELTTTAILAIIDQRWAPKKKRRKIGYINVIEELLKRRNRIAHGEGREPIAVSDLRNATTNITTLASGLHELLSNQLKQIVPT